MVDFLEFFKRIFYRSNHWFELIEAENNGISREFEDITLAQGKNNYIITFKKDGGNIESKIKNILAAADSNTLDIRKIYRNANGLSISLPSSKINVIEQLTEINSIEIDRNLQFTPPIVDFSEEHFIDSYFESCVNFGMRLGGFKCKERTKTQTKCRYSSRKSTVALASWFSAMRQQNCSNWYAPLTSSCTI